MKKYLIPLFLTILSASTTLLGLIPTFISKKYHNIIIGTSLSLATTVMFITSCFILIPEGISYLVRIKKPQAILLTILFINIGFITINYLSKYINENTKEKALYKIGLIGTISIILHNIPEGIITFTSTNNNLKIGISLAISIAMHNIPEGISIAIPLYYATNNRKITFIYTFIAGFSELFGGIIAYIFLRNINSPLFLAFLIELTAGIMLYLSIFEILPTTLKYQKKYTIIGYLIGVIIIMITNFYLT